MVVVYPDGWLKITDELAVGDIGPDPGPVA
jgi:hypothetical protein